jgi:hypothetical protein
MAIIEFTRRHMEPSGSLQHEHIASLRWQSMDTGETAASTLAVLVEWVEDGGVGLVHPGPRQSRVGVVDPGNGRPKYLRSCADGDWCNNLLSLPTF